MVIFIQLNNVTIFCDVHGVLVNSAKMIKNYENSLVQLFKHYNIPRDKAIDYHKQGLELYIKLLNEIKLNKPTGSLFLQEMDIADKKWDKLLQSFVTTSKALELESRQIEYLAGTLSNTFYIDGKEFISNLQDKISINTNLDYYIVSNSHSKHLEGLFAGAGLEDIDRSKLLGWDKIGALKNTDYYYIQLKKIAHTSEVVIIGNSREEMVYGKKSNFKTIFVEREVKGKIDYTNSMDLRIENLKELSNILFD